MFLILFSVYIPNCSSDISEYFSNNRDKISNSERVTCVSVNQNHVVLGGFVILSQPVGLLQRIQQPSRPARRIQVQVYVRIRANITVVSAPPDAIVLVVLGSGAVLDRVLYRSFPPRFPPRDYVGADSRQQKRHHDQDHRRHKQTHVARIVFVIVDA